jgi:DNA-binding NtrC family response regulator
MQDSLSVLAIDDDPTQLELLRVFSEEIDYPRIEYYAAKDAQEAFAVLEKNTIELVLTDFRLPGLNGLEILKHVKNRNPEIRVVVMTAYQNTEEAVEILKTGADDYLIKPTKAAEIRRIFIMTNERLEYEKESSIKHREIDDFFEDSSLIYRSRAMMEVLRTATVSAMSDSTVLITGESGTGKELIARMIHDKSRRFDKSFITVNISALPESLAESELFGHRKGAFTGAGDDRMGRFEEAKGGTIFIDEVGDITPALQVKLLRVLQFGEIQRIGENVTRKLDVRIIAATHRDLKDSVRRNLFRGDLFYRINVIPIHIPPLRRRKEDIPALIDYFIRKFSQENGKTVRNVSREVLDRTMARSLFGNVRELENLIERGVVFSRGEIITLRDIPALLEDEDLRPDGCEDTTGIGTFEERIRNFEIRVIEEALSSAEGNQTRAAELLGMSERHMRSRIKNLNIQNRFRI